MSKLSDLLDSIDAPSVEDRMRALIGRANQLEHALDGACKSDDDAAALMIVAMRSFAGRDAATALAEAFARGFVERKKR